MYDDDVDKGKKSIPHKKTVKLIACGQCEGCKRKACKKCEACTGTPRKRCIHRVCTNIRRATETGKASSNGKRVAHDDRSNGDENGQEMHKPRIRLKLSSGKKSPSTELRAAPGKKRKATPQKTIDRPTKKSRTSSAKRASPSSSDESDEDEEETMFDVNQLQSEYDNLDGTWEAARDFFVKFGVWRLPRVIESKFEEVAKITLTNISK